MVKQGHCSKKKNVNIPAGKVSATLVLVAFQEQQLKNSLMMVAKSPYLLVQNTIYHEMILAKSLSAGQVLTKERALLLDL